MNDKYGPYDMAWVKAPHLYHKRSKPSVGQLLKATNQIWLWQRVVQLCFHHVFSVACVCA